MSNQDNPYAGSAGGYSTGGTLQGSVSTQSPPEFVAPKPAAADPQSVKDVSTQTFMSDVIDASKSGPVVVDFWAPWCGPCKQLGPVIEKVAKATPGVTLCKMDVEQYPEISQQMGIQSIPAVVAFIDGRPADAFMGAKSEREVQAFFEKLASKVPQTDAQADTVAAMDEARTLMESDQHGEAAELYAAILAQEPGNVDAFAGLGQCYVAVGEVDLAQALIDKIPEEHRNTPPLVALMKAIELARQGAEAGDLAELAASVEDNPKDHQLRMDYALALNAVGQREEATEQLVAIVRADRKWKDDGARAQLLELFEAWGNTDPATLAGRRSLSSVLFS